MDRAIERPTKALMFGVLGTGLVFFALKGKENSETPPHPEGPFEVVSTNETDLVVRQEGKDYALKIQSLPDEIKKSLIEQRPDLKSFIENGPIRIIK